MASSYTVSLKGELSMVRIPKKLREQGKSFRKHRPPSPKTGSKQDQLSLGYKSHKNAIDGEHATQAFIPKIK
jgi:hypothetical protein